MEKQKLNRTHNTVRNITFGVINKIVLLFFPFILKTMIVYYMGLDYAGLNNLFVAILQVLNLSELGFSSAVVYSMYKPIAENDIATINALLKYYKTIYRTIGGVILILGLGILPFIPMLIKGAYPDDINIYVLFFIYLINTCISYWGGGYFTSILNAYQRTDIISNISTCTVGSMYVIQIIVLMVYRNYYLYIIFLPVFTLINNVITFYIVKKKYPNLTSNGLLNETERKKIKKNISGIMINKLCETSRNSFDSIFISAFLGLTANAIYSNYYCIMSSILALLDIIGNSMLAGVGNSIQVESREQNYNDLKKFNCIYMWIGGFCTTSLVCIYQPFMELWMGKDGLLSFKIVILFAVYFYVRLMGNMTGVYFIAAGLWWEGRIKALLEAACNLILNFLLVKKWGIAGVIIGTLIPLILINLIYGQKILFKYYFQNNKEWEYFRTELKFFFMEILFCSFIYVICQKTIINLGLIQSVFCNLMICICVFNVMYWITIRNCNEFKEMLNWVMKRKQ